jgi:hypothetical protein
MGVQSDDADDAAITVTAQPKDSNVVLSGLFSVIRVIRF